MRYFKQIDSNGEIDMLLTYGDNVNITDPLIIEITENEYSAILEEVRANIEEPPEPSDDDEISGAEFLNMIEGVM